MQLLFYYIISLKLSVYHLFFKRLYRYIKCMPFSNKCLYCNKNGKSRMMWVATHYMYLSSSCSLMERSCVSCLWRVRREWTSRSLVPTCCRIWRNPSYTYIYSLHLSFNKLLHLEIGQSMHQAGESFFVENLGNIFRRMIPEKILFVLFVTTWLVLIDI